MARIRTPQSAAHVRRTYASSKISKKKTLHNSALKLSKITQNVAGGVASNHKAYSLDPIVSYVNVN